MADDINYPINLEQKHVEGAHLFATREDMIRALAPRFRGGIVAEIGVDKGDFSKFLLDEAEPTRLDAYDNFLLHELSGQYNGNIIEEWLVGGEKHLDYYTRRFRTEIDMV